MTTTRKPPAAPMTPFGTQRDTLSDVMDLNTAMRDEFEELMRLKHGTPDAYFRATGVDKRNFYKVLSRNPQVKWLIAHLEHFNVPIGVFFDDVAKRQAQ